MLRFFIDRPILASVISTVIVLLGGTALALLPVEQYPDVVPPQVVVSANYPGASAEVLADSVAAPLEQEINGVDDMIFMESSSSDAGMLRLVITFALGTDPDQAAINVNNRVQAALPRLPQQVRNLGVRVEARSTNILLLVALTSPDGSRDELFLNNYGLLNVIDELVRLPGVGEASLFGAQDYSMRIWLRPDRLAQYDLTPGDVAAALREQNAQFAAGQLGAEPAPDQQAFTYTITTRGQLSRPEQFEQIILRADPHGAVLRLGDVARVELGARDYAFSAIYNGEPTVPIGVYLQPGANALDTAERVRAQLREIAERFPAGVGYAIPYDTTEFVAIAVSEVRTTLFVAIALVVLVTFVFLQHLRATAIPVIAIPVALIGTFAGMLALGFSINLLTLFGLVLAIGIVVDDAIVVMENVERLMAEKQLKAREAAIETVRQVAGAVVATTLVLVAVFLPVAFVGGLSGVLYRQFAVTIVVAVSFSSVVALTLTPALCALLLDRQKTAVPAPFRVFNRAVEHLTDAFVGAVGVLLRQRTLGLLAFAGVCALALLLFARLPGGLVPQEDQGVALVVAELPPVAALGRSMLVRDRLSDALQDMDEIQDVIAFAGFDVIAGSLRTSGVAGFLNLADWSQRRAADQQADAVVRRVMGAGAAIQEANVFAFVPPPIQGLSLTGGVEGYLQVRGDPPAAEIEATAQRVAAAANDRPELVNVRTTINAGIPRYRAEVDLEKARAAGVPIDSIFDALGATFGALYVNDFTYQGRLWQVNLQSEATFRRQGEDLRQVFVRAGGGEMVPVSALVRLERTRGSDIADRFNLYRAARLLADPAPGHSSAQAKAALEETVARINAETGEELMLGWIGEAYQLEAAAGVAGTAFVLGLVMVFLILAAQYERLVLPLAVVGAVPFGLLGAVLFALARDFPNDIYFQIGILVLIGLAAKNAILIVEFAAQNRAAGMSAVDAALGAARQRFRAIMMTALTFIAGTLPLMFASGAGAASRQEIGTVVVGGMILASSLALVFVPLFYVLLEELASRRRAR